MLLRPGEVHVVKGEPERSLTALSQCPFEFELEPVAGRSTEVLERCSAAWVPPPGKSVLYRRTSMSACSASRNVKDCAASWSPKSVLRDANVTTKSTARSEVASVLTPASTLIVQAATPSLPGGTIPNSSVGCRIVRKAHGFAPPGTGSVQLSVAFRLTG